MNKHQHGKLTLEKNILPLLLPRIETATFRSRVLLSTIGLPIPPSMLGTIRWLDGRGRGMGRGGGGGGGGMYRPENQQMLVSYRVTKEFTLVLTRE